jgi:hypothetical protein
MQNDIMKKYSDKILREKMLLLALRYSLAYEEIFQKLPEWKRNIVRQNKDGNDRVIQEFTKEVCDKAENYESQ